jgi:hypothetical protein
MQSESFDKKIKEAAEQHSPAPHEGAWEKMETLLDKHLPQKRKNNRTAFLLLLGFLLIGGGTFILVKKPFSNNVSITETPTRPNVAVPETKNNSINNETVNTNSQQQSEIPGIENRELNVNPNLSPHLAENNLNVKNIADSKETRIASEPVKDVESQILENNSNKIPPANQNDFVQDDKKGLPQNAIPANDTPAETGQVEQQVTNPDNEKNKVTKTKKGFLRNLAFTISAGPDISFVEMKYVGSTQLIYGAGLSFPVSKQFTLRSGFFVSRKIYSAPPEDYNPPYNFWSYYPNLKQIDADCKIYDLALMADYNFGKTRNWFGSLGVSNLFMKRETYDYLYKPTFSQQYVTYSHTYNNENNHYFSVLNISGGYTRKLSNSVSLRAEPYLKLPLAGVGHGKIKLGSGGILITTSITPFATKSNQKQ